MAYDHYVSQVHLKQFGDPEVSGRLNVTRKSDLRSFQAWPRDICRVADGSSNPYLQDPRIIEEFLKDIEPAYDRCLNNMRNEQIGAEERRVFSGFFAFTGAYTPTALRLNEPMQKKFLDKKSRILADNGEIPPFPVVEDPRYSGKALTDLLDNGLISFRVDAKMPQAIATVNMGKTQTCFANSDWTIVHADSESSFFFTSDHPRAILAHKENKYAQRVFPIAPDLAVIVHTDTSVGRAGPVRNHFTDPKKQAVRLINSKIIQFAGDIVIYSRKQPWVKEFIRKHKDFTAKMNDLSSGPLILFQEGVSKNN